MVGLGQAIEDATGEHLAEKMGYVKKLTDRLVKGIMDAIPYTHYTGDPVNRLPGTASFVFEAIEGEGSDSAYHGSGRHLRLDRFGLLDRLARSLARAHGHRPAPRDRARFAASDSG